MARLSKATEGQKAQKKEDLSSFKEEHKKRHGKLARLAGRFALISALAISPAFAQQGSSASGQAKQGAETSAIMMASMFPALERITSFNEPGKEKLYNAEVIRVMRNISSFVQNNRTNKAFVLITEAVMDEVLNVQTDKEIYYYVDAYDSSVTIADSLKNWKKRITMSQAPHRVEISVETEGEPKLLLTLTEGSSPSSDSIDKLRYRLYTFFDDLFGSELFIMASMQ